MKKFREWRAIQIAKMLLYNSEQEINVEDSPIKLFDLFVSINNTSCHFGVIVRGSTFAQSIEFSKSLSQLKLYKKNNMINIPILLFCINSNEEIGTYDFIVKIDGSEFIINDDIQFKKITPKTLADTIELISRGTATGTENLQ